MFVPSDRRAQGVELRNNGYGYASERRCTADHHQKSHPRGSREWLLPLFDLKLAESEVRLRLMPNDVVSSSVRARNFWW
jgi:hypothetical protein